MRLATRTSREAWWRVYVLNCVCGREYVVGTAFLRGTLSDLFVGHCPSCAMGRRKAEVVAEAPAGCMAAWDERDG